MKSYYVYTPPVGHKSTSEGELSFSVEGTGVPVLCIRWRGADTAVHKLEVVLDNKDMNTFEIEREQAIIEWDETHAEEIDEDEGQD